MISLSVVRFGLTLSPIRFGKICKATERRDFGKLASSMLDPPILTGPAIVHGQVHEASAIKKFVEVTGKKVQSTGNLCLV
jgi:hypothetical protein